MSGYITVVMDHSGKRLVSADDTLVSFYDEGTNLWGLRDAFGSVIYDSQFTEWQSKLLASTEHTTFEEFLRKLPALGCLAEWERQDKIASELLNSLQA